MSPTAFPTNSRSFPSSITIALPSSRLPHDLLHLRVLFHPEAPALAADAALLEAAEGRVEEVDAVVDPHHPGADALGERDRPGGVARQHHAAEPVGGVVRDADRLVLVRERDHGHDGPEDLLLRDADPVGHGAEDGGLEEVAAPEVLRPAPAVGEDGALALARLDVLLDLLPPLLADDGPEERARVGGIADLHHPLHEVDHLLDQGVVRLARDEDARGHGAACPAWKKVGEAACGAIRSRLSVSRKMAS